MPKITHPRILQKVSDSNKCLFIFLIHFPFYILLFFFQYLKGTSDYKAHILVQPRNSLDSQDSQELQNTTSLDDETYISPKKPKTTSIEESPDRAASGTYTCHACNFTTTRLNVMILHNKSHSAGYVPYTPVKKPVSKSPLLKAKSKSETLSINDDENIDFVDKKKKASKTRARPKNLLETISADISIPSSPMKSQIKDKLQSPPKRKLKSKEKESKKPKTDVEIKNSLLADWNEDSDEESMDILTSLKLTENQNSSALLVDRTDKNSSLASADVSKLEKNTSEKLDDVTNKDASKIEKREQASCFDFEEDEDLQIEKIGRKIPRVSSKSEDNKKVLDSNLSVADSESGTPISNTTDDIKSDVANSNNSQIDTVDLDSEVDNLLKETAVPELPSLLSESNFQKSKVVKVPDKDGDPQYIFKTKTFFRSRHSRGQDAIEKYVADNTTVDKPFTYTDGSTDSDKTNISEESKNKKDNIDDGSKETIKSDTVKVTKFAPKIQFKKMKAVLNRNKSQDMSESDLTDDPSKVNKSDDDRIKTDKIDSVNSNKSLISPSESDLQIAEALINLPKSTVHDAPVEHKSSKSESKEAIQSEQVTTDLLNQQNKDTVNLNINDTLDKPKESTVGTKTQIGSAESKDSVSKVDTQLPEVPNESLKLHRILDNSSKNTSKSPVKIIQAKPVKPHGKEKILNFDVGSSSVTRSGKAPEDQKIIIRRKASPLKLNTFESNAFNESSQELLRSSKSNKWNEDEIQTFTIEGASGSNEDLLDPKLKKVSKSTLIKPHNISLGSDMIAQSKEHKISDDSLLEVKVKPSENQLNSDSFLISQSPKRSTSISEAVKSESALTPENLEKSPQIKKSVDVTSPMRPKIIVKSPIEKTVSPNILSKSIKTKAMKQLVIVDKNLGEKHLFISQSDNNSQSFQAIEGLVKETSSASQQVQKKKIIIDTSNLPVGKKSQKIILNTLPKGQVSASVIGDSGQSDIEVKPKNSTKSDQIKSGTEAPAGSTFMIITNPQGVQSKIVIGPEHHKLLFPKSKVVQQSALNTSKPSNASPSPTKNKTPQLVIGSDQIIISESIGTLITSESQVHTISKPKTTLINSKGQIIMSGNSKRILTTTPGQAILTSKGQIIAPQSSIITSSAKLMPSVNKSTTLMASHGQNILSSKPVQSQKIVGKVGDIVSKQEKTLTINTSKVSTKALSNKKPGQNLIASQGQIKDSIIPKKEKALTINPNKVISKGPGNRGGQTTTIIQAQIKDPSLYLSQKSGTITLTAAQFEHLQKTGQLVAKNVPQKLTDSQNKLPSGKTQNQRFILKRITDSKQVPDTVSTKSSNLEMLNRKKTEKVLTSEVPPLTPINSEKSTVHSKKPKSNNTSTSVHNCNNVKTSDSEDSNSLENLDKLIPASIIPTRKRDSTAPKVSEKESKNATQEVKESNSKTATESPSDNLTLSGNALADSQKQLLAIPGENFGGPPNSFFLCVEENGTLTPVDNQPLVLENNQLVPMTMPLPAVSPSLDTEAVLMSPGNDLPNTIKGNTQVESTQMLELPVNQTQQNILINTGEQQLLVDQQTFLSLLSGNEQIVLPNGQHLVLQGGTGTQQFLNEELARLLTDNQQTLLNASGSAEANSENQKMIITASSDGISFTSDGQSNQDILAAALAGTEVFESDSLIHETINVSTVAETALIEIDSLSPNLQNVNTTVHSNVFETSSTLNQPIMSPLEHPSNKNEKTTNSGLLAISKDTKINPKNLEDSLAVIGVATTNVPTSLELPITVTNPRIAAKTTSPMNTMYQSGLLTNTIVSPGIAIFDSDVNLTDSSSPSKQKNEIVKNKTESLLLETKTEVKKDELNLNTSDKNEKMDVEVSASSMPCLDDTNVENKSENKTYSPISMPILTDDPEDVTAESNSSETKMEVSTESDDKNLDSLQEKESEVPISTEVKMVESDELSQAENVSQTEENITENVPETISDVSVETVEVANDNKTPEKCDNGAVDNSLECHKDSDDIVEKTSELEIEETDNSSVSNHIVQEEKTETIVPLPALETESVIDSEQKDNVELPDEICVETPPEFTREQSPINYEDQEMEESIIHNETEENSIPDHTCETSPDMATAPETTMSSIETMSTTPEPPVSTMLFSESSSDDSTEIPMQPEITVSHHMVQNFSSLLNNSSLEEKSNDCANSESKVSEEFENGDKNVDNYEADSER